MTSKQNNMIGVSLKDGELTEYIKHLQRIYFKKIFQN
jgi:hypothetical protein